MEIAKRFLSYLHGMIRTYKRYSSSAAIHWKTILKFKTALKGISKIKEKWAKPSVFQGIFWKFEIVIFQKMFEKAAFTLN